MYRNEPRRGDLLSSSCAPLTQKTSAIAEVFVIDMVQISNQFLSDLEKLASIYRDLSIENKEDIEFVEKAMNTRYNTVQKIQMDKKAKQKKRARKL